MLKIRNTRIHSLLYLTIFLCLVQITIFLNSVHADDDRIHLKNGGFLAGQIMEVIPEQYATIRLADETVRKIEWAEIDRVELAPEQAAEPPPVQLPQQQPEAPQPITPAGTSSFPTIQYEERTRSGIPGLYIPGFVIFGTSWLLTVAIGPSVSKANDDDDDEGRFDDDSSDPAGVDLVASFVPVFGPWIGLASTESRVPKQLWVLSGATQAIGAAMAIAGLSLSRTLRVPVYKTDNPSGVKAAYLSPTVLGQGGTGLNFNLVHY